jgi:hypothetical protein
MKNVGYIQKDITIGYGQGKGYSALSERAVLEKVRKHFKDEGVMIFPKHIDLSKEGNLTSVNVLYDVVDTETGVSMTMASAGQGSDSQDKGVGKAQTYAFKALIVKMLMLISGDDPDYEDSDELDEQDKWDAAKKELILAIEGQYDKLRANPAKKVSTNVKYTGNGKLERASIEDLTTLTEVLAKYIKMEDDLGDKELPATEGGLFEDEE